MGLHSILPPSGAYQWMKCPGSITACQGMEDQNSEPAMLGSIAHDLAYCCLVYGCDAIQYCESWGWYSRANKTGFHSVKQESPGILYQVQVDYEMAGHVQTYLNQVRQQVAAFRLPSVHAELKMDMTWLFPGMFGTGDMVAREMFSQLYIADLKYGFKLVEPEDNPQLKIYALGALGPDNINGITEVIAEIIQPRAPHSSGPARRVYYTPAELYEWAQTELVPAAQRAMDPNAPRVAGEHCVFCDVEATCPERRAYSMALMPLDMNVHMGTDGVPGPVLQVPDANSMTGDQLDNYLDFFAAIKPIEKAVRTRAFHLADKGLPDAPRRYKIIQGKASRSWNVPDDAVIAEAGKYLPPDMISKNLLNSPAKMEASLSAAGLPKTALKHLIKSTHGKSMVPITDPKPALQSSADTFGIINI